MSLTITPIKGFRSTIHIPVDTVFEAVTILILYVSILLCHQVWSHLSIYIPKFIFNYLYSPLYYGRVVYEFFKSMCIGRFY